MPNQTAADAPFSLRLRRLWPAAVLAAIAAFGGFAAGAQTSHEPAQGPRTKPGVASAASGPAAEGERRDFAPRLPSSQSEINLSFAPVVKASAPAVVNVFAESTTRSPYADDPFFRRFFNSPIFGAPADETHASLGSGVILRADGVIVTNAHVVAGADRLRVVLSDRREFPAKLIVADPHADLAVLKIDAQGAALPILRYADTHRLSVGDLVIAIGNPFGVGQTVTQGIVSATARTEINPGAPEGGAPGGSNIASYIQTDAAINPGNSGGALVNLAGELVGINSAILSRDGQSSGIGFAIPSELVRRVVESALAEGRVVRTWLGVKTQAVTPDVARSLGLAAPQGAIVSDLYPGGPAALAGLRQGDVILAVDDSDIVNDEGVRFVAATKKPNDPVRISFLRAGQRAMVEARIAALPDRPAEKTIISARSPFAGAEVFNLSPAAAERFGLDPFKNGVIVGRIAAQSVAAYLSLQPGDIVREVNGVAINDVATLQRTLARNAGQWRVAVERDGQVLRADIEL